MKSSFRIMAFRIATIVAAVLAIQAGGCKSASTRLDNSNLRIDEIRRDHLGMSLKDYARMHPSECSGQGVCVGDETYAGVTAMKSADFTDDGKLWQISYSSDATFADQLLTALKEKYGDPGCAPQADSCNWSNGHATIRFVNTGKNAMIHFVDEQLSKEVSEEYERDQAAKRRNDQ